MKDIILDRVYLTFVIHLFVLHPRLLHYHFHQQFLNPFMTPFHPLFIPKLISFFVFQFISSKLCLCSLLIHAHPGSTFY